VWLVECAALGQPEKPLQGLDGSSRSRVDGVIKDVLAEYSSSMASMWGATRYSRR